MKEVYKIQCGKSALFKPLIFLLVISFILSYQAYFYPDKIGMALVLSGVVIIPYIIPELYLNYQYWRNDFNQTVTVDLSSRAVEIAKGASTVLFSIKEVVACDFINVRPGTRIYRDHAYLRIKTANDTFIITHLTVRPEVLLDKLGIPYNDVVVFFPSLDYEKISPKQQAKNQAYFEKKKKEFLDRYSSFQNSELEEIIKNRGRYADYAVAAAMEIEKSRRINSVNKV
jgi:hypothetical protein